MFFDTASFKDPSGQVFRQGDRIFRSIYAFGSEEFEAAKNNKIYSDLIDRGYLIPHHEVDVDDSPEGTIYCLEHPRLPMVTYPWEWPFSMLKDAAFLHLDVMEMIIPKGFWLRDASAFNVQYTRDGITLIDTLSVGTRVPDSPWVAYKQFCAHFLAPLALSAYCDIRCLGLWRNYIDGYPLDLAVKMLPFFQRYRLRLYMHLVLHSRFQENADRKENVRELKQGKIRKVSDLALLGLIRSLRKCIKNIKWKVNSQIWASYELIRTYDERDVAQKAEYVRKIVKKTTPRMVWDLGANTGEFSLIAAENGSDVVSIDADPACTEFLYNRLLKENKLGKIIPLTMDLANPSPGLGWDSRERLSLSQRGPADLLLALALIHHLVFSANTPLGKIAEWFASLGNYLLVEFMPPEDPMIRKLTMNRPEHLPYSIDAFKTGFGQYFDFLESMELSNKRILFFCKKR